MYAYVPRYIAIRSLRHTLLCAAIVATGFLAGCGSISFPMGSNDVEAPLDLTGSIDGIQNSADLDISPEDRAVIAKTISAAPAGVTSTLAWSSHISGNSGTITALAPDTGSSGTGCRSFETTANTVTGIRTYTGIVCRDLRKVWTVVELQAKRDGFDDAAS